MSLSPLESCLQARMNSSYWAGLGMSGFEPESAKADACALGMTISNCRLEGGGFWCTVLHNPKQLAGGVRESYRSGMSDLALVVAFVVAQGFLGLLFLKLLPSAITKLVDTEIERRSDIKLEKVKGQIESSYSTLKTSMEMLTVSNTGLHPHIIDSVSALWNLIVQMKHDFSGMVTFDNLFLADEAAKAFKDEGSNQNLIAFVDKHRDELDNLATNGAVLEPDLDRHRLFCGDKLWLIFFIVRAVYMRSSLLIARSFQIHDFNDWRKDDGIRQLLSAVLPTAFIADVRSRESGGLSIAISQLEAEFLHEATRVMSGSKAMADSLTNMQSVLQLQNAEITAKLRNS